MNSAADWVSGRVTSPLVCGAFPVPESREVRPAAAYFSKTPGAVIQGMMPPSADVTQAMEELTCLFEERTSKALSQRKVALEAPGFPRGYGWILAARGQFPDLPDAGTFARWVRQLQEAPPQNAREWLARLQQFCREPALQRVVAEALLQSALCRETCHQRELSEAMAILAGERAVELRAGVNLAEWVKSQTPHPQELQTWRDLYRDEVQGFSTPQACFRSLLAARGAEGMGEAIVFLMKGCGIELHCCQPSLQPEALRRILLDLQCVEVLRSLLERTALLLERMAHLFNESCPLSSCDLVERLLVFAEMPQVSEREMAALMCACQWRKGATRLAFGREWVGVLRRLPMRLFREEAHYEALVLAGRRHLERLVAAEEEGRL